MTIYLLLISKLYTVDGVKLDNDPLVTVISFSVKSVVASDEVNFNSIGELFDVSPLETVFDVIVMVSGEPPFNLQLNISNCPTVSFISENFL